MTYGQRLRSVQVHGSVQATQTKKRYYDEAAINDQFGGSAKERKAMLEHDTKGIGFVKTGKDGKLYHKDRKTKDVERLSPKDARFFASQD